MSSVTNSSATNSASQHSSDHKPASTKTAETEAEFLQRQANDAKGALSKTMRLIGAELSRGSSVGAWSGEHPWVALSAATVAGFAAAATVIPSKEQRTLRHLAKLEKALHPEPDPEYVSHKTNGNGHDRALHNGEAPKAKEGFLAGVARDLIRAGLPALSTLLAAGLNRDAAPTAAADVTDDNLGTSGD